MSLYLANAKRKSNKKLSHDKFILQVPIKQPFTKMFSLCYRSAMTNKVQSGPQKRFHAALVWILDQKGRGSQARLARKLQINSGYLSTVVNGGTISDNMAEAIAAYFGYTYEDMLILGRNLLEGEQPPAPASDVSAIPPDILEAVKDERVQEIVRAAAKLLKDG